MHAILGGNWPRIAGLVAAFNKDHDALALITRAHDQAILANQELAIESGELNIRLNELAQLVEEYKAKLIESDRNATLVGASSNVLSFGRFQNAEGFVAVFA